MVNLLAAAGLVFIVLALWMGRNQAVRERLELDEYKKVRDELAETKKEVGSLLEQLEEVSERIVEEITATVEEVRDSKHAGDIVKAQGEDVSTDIDTQNTDTPDIDKQDIDGPEKKAILSGDYLGDYEDEDEMNENEIDRSKPEVIVELTGKPTEIRTYHRGKPEVKPSINTKPGSAGKTILFPRKVETYPEKPSGVNRNESGSEVPPKHQMVYAMAKLGYSEADIAKQLAIGRGEVRLILQLKRKGEEANG